MAGETHPTSESLLDAAEELFAARGYAGVSVREIADRADANVAAVSYHFGSKSALYLQTVARAMQRRESMSAWQLLEQPPVSRAEAAALLFQFIRELAARILENDPSPACRLLMHEAAGPTEALDSVVNEYLRPQEALLSQTLRVLLPKATEIELACTVHSVLGQVLHYVTLRPLIERLNIGPIDNSKRGVVGEHIARFTLRGLGCSEQEIVDASNAPFHQEGTTS